MDGEWGAESHIVHIQRVHFVLPLPALLVSYLLVRREDGIVGVSATLGLGKRVLGGGEGE